MSIFNHGVLDALPFVFLLHMVFMGVHKDALKRHPLGFVSTIVVVFFLDNVKWMMLHCDISGKF